jgi:hypothetical protein
MTKASDSAEPFGSERLDLSSSTGLKAEGLVAGRQSLRKDPINIVLFEAGFYDHTYSFCG